jgi:hypothetical protein
MAFLGGATRAEEPILVVKPEAFPTLVNPNCSHCRDEAKRRGKELRDKDRVLCWIRGYSDGGAIPFRFFLNKYRVISDSYGTFVYDREAGYARGFAPSYNYRFRGWRNGIMVMQDLKDGTLYSCLSGVGFEGACKGTRLQPIPTLVSDWGVWLEHYPHAVAYHMYDKYQPTELLAELKDESRGSRGPTDGRLPGDDLVLGVAAGNQARAFPLEAIAKAGLIHETLNGQPCAVLWHGPTRTAAAYVLEAAPPRKFSAPRPNKDGVSPPDEQLTTSRPVSLVRDDKDAAAPFVDKETGSRWDIAGRAVAGELKGWTLAWLDSTQVKWYAWSAEYPQTTLYGKYQ